MESTRRTFFRGCLAGALAPSPSRVVVARDTSLRLPSLLDQSVMAFYNRDSAQEAWKLVAKPGEVIGLKVNCLSGHGGSTSVALVEAIAERLQQVGVPGKNIVIFDRLNSDLESAGFKPGSGRPRCIGNDSSGYEEDLEVHGSVGSRVSRALTRTCDAVINLPVLKDHGIVGVTMALKNLFGAIHNPNKYHPNNGNPYVADVNMLAPIRNKVRLTICDATVAQYEGGPSYMPQWSWAFNGLLVARDPVALDTIGWQIIEAKRAEMGLPTLKAAGREPKYIATAADAAHRLGVNDPARIEKVEV